MSPTISAATKAVALVPRKKILAERNEAFTLTDSPKPLVGSSRSIRSYCSPDNDCDEQISFDGNSLLTKKPYDPLTNYLSPRPKFLRYNPNKKRRIFLHGENEIKKIKDGLGFVSTSSSFESQKVVEERTFEEGGLKNKYAEMEKTEGNCKDCGDEGVEEVEESEEFEEEEKCWSLFGLLKFLLVLCSLFLSTSFIYSINSPDPSLIQEAVWEFRGEFVNQSNLHAEAAIRKEYVISEIEVTYGKGEESHISLLYLVKHKAKIDNEFAEAGISEDNGNGDGLLDSTVELPEITIENSEDIYDDGLMSKVEAFGTLQWAEVIKGETDTDIKVFDSKAEALDSRPIECIKDEEMESTEDAFDQVQGAETVELLESFQEDLTIEPSNDLNIENVIMENEEIKVQLEVLALAVSLSIIAALGFLYRSRRRNIGEDIFFPTQKNNGKEDSLPMETQHRITAPVKAAHQIQNSNAICSAKEEKMKKVESIVSPSTTPSVSLNVDIEDFSRQSQGPIVELLGELVIGEEANSSFNSNKRRRVLDSEVKNSNNYPFTEMMISQSKAPLVENQRYLPQPELSNAADSSSQKKKSVFRKEVKFLAFICHSICTLQFIPLHISEMLSFLYVCRKAKAAN